MKSYFKRNWDLIIGNFMYLPLGLLILLSFVGLTRAGLLFWILAWSFLIAFFVAPVFTIIALVRNITNKQLRKSWLRWILIGLNILFGLAIILLAMALGSMSNMGW